MLEENDWLLLHTAQKKFLKAFMAWDDYKMADAFIEIIEAVSNSVCSDETKNEIEWSCRELLDGMQGHPNISACVYLPDYPFQIYFNVGVDWTRKPFVLKHPAVKFQITFNDPTGDFKKKWQELGFSSDEISIDRDFVKTPFPMKDEPGYSLKQKPRINIHKPKFIEKPDLNFTYAYALSVESIENNKWLTRYLNGEHKKVWDEMLMLGQQIREPDLLTDAIAVVHETMRRCRKNVEQIISHLNSVDYPFKYPDEAFCPPEVNTMERIEELENSVGTLPLSLCAWYEIVGSVNLIPHEESDWMEGYSDPLCVYPGNYCLEYEDSNWQRERYVISVSPDDYHKADTSGGAPYEIGFPNSHVDALLENEQHNTTFVDYLRLSFKACGFPGGLGESVRGKIDGLSEKMLPI